MRSAIEASPLLALFVLAGSFAVLAKSADVFVDSAVALAYHLRLPKLVVGIVLVSFATTAPELSVSLIAALRNKPEMALGNAVGSVICNAGLALALCALVAARAIRVIPRLLRSSGLFLLLVAATAYAFTAFDYTLSRGEGLILLGAFAVYITFLYHEHATGSFSRHIDEEANDAGRTTPPMRLVPLFILSLAGILATAELIVTSASTLAAYVGVPDTIIALTMVAFGTSVPEVATCVSAARKGHGDVAVGNILGANIMNICWVAGASAVANALCVTPREVMFMFPAMFVLVLAMLLMMRLNWRVSRAQGTVLLGLYIAYLGVSYVLFVPR